MKHLIKLIILVAIVFVMLLSSCGPSRSQRYSDAKKAREALSLDTVKVSTEPRSYGTFVDDLGCTIGAFDDGTGVALIHHPTCTNGKHRFNLN